MDCPDGCSAYFATTHWTVVVQAGHDSSPGASEALETLCQAYWYPIYAYIRRRGLEPADAQDLTQEFFTGLLQKHFFSAADRSKGRFRCFLLAALQYFLAKERRRGRTQKRGGGQPILSLDDANAEARYRLEPVSDVEPEKLFERRWALTLLEETLARLQEECQASGKGQLFKHLEGVLSGEKSDAGYRAIAAEMGMSEGAVKVAAHRLRQRYGQLLREQIAQTVARPEEIDDEVRYLFAVLS